MNSSCSQPLCTRAITRYKNRRICNRCYDNDYAARNREAIRARANKNTPKYIEHKKQYDKKHYQNNAERIKGNVHKYYQENKEVVKERVKAYYEQNKEAYIWRAKMYSRRFRDATPAWAELEEIENFYRNCPPGYEVDHIIPLQGEEVTGLHVLSNLQYLTVSENRRKSNKFNPEVYKNQCLIQRISAA